MRDHVRLHHPDISADVGLTASSASPTPTSTSVTADEDKTRKRKRQTTGLMDQFVSVKVKKGSPHWNSITDSVMGYVVGAHAPLETVNYRCFRNMVHTLNPGKSFFSVCM